MRRILTAALAACFAVSAAPVSAQSDSGQISIAITDAVGKGSLDLQAATGLLAIVVLLVVMNCSGQMTLTITKTVSTKILTVSMGYGSGNFFHGGANLTSTVPGPITFTMTMQAPADSCLTSFATTISVYDGPPNGPSTLLATIPQSYTATCH